MDLKQKIKNLGTKIKNNADEIIAVSVLVGGTAAVALAAYYKIELDRSRANHQECHDFAEWVVNKTKDGEVKTIWQEDRGSDGFIHIHKLDETKDAA